MGEKSTTKVSIADIEKAMGRKADRVGEYTFDPETFSWGRTITFDLKKKPKRKGAKK